MPVLLILGGTSDAYALADALADQPGWRVVTSLAGRTGTPRLPAGEARVGGFGGVGALGEYLRAEGIDRVVDATHPFAARMGWNAAEACAAAGVPLLRLERPAWTPGPGDRWTEVADWDGAGAALAQARRVLLAVGRQELAPFAALDHVWFLVRSVERPETLSSFAQAELVLARGPFTLEGELALLRDRRIDTVVCKNSGGPTDVKLVAARQLGIGVVMRRRPDRPALPTVGTVGQAVAWLKHRAR